MQMMNKAEAGGVGGLGIVIEKGPMKQTDSGIECRIKVIAQLPDEGEHALNAAWVRSLFLICISEPAQTKAITNLIKGRLLFEGDIVKVSSEPPIIRFSMGLEISRELSLKLYPGRYYIQVSARQFLSNQIILECT
jgi:hypothetical protein